MRSRKRSSGEGSIVRLKSGRWAAVIELPRHPNGKRNRKWRRARTEAEAKRHLREMLDEYQELGGRALSGRTVESTVNDYLRQVRAPKNQSKTDQTRDQLFADVTTSFLGPDRKTSDVDVTACDALLAAFACGEIAAGGKPVSIDYVRRMRGFLRGAIGNDVRQGYLRSNPADYALLPQITAESRERIALSVDQWQRLYSAARGRLRLGVDLGARHGLRPQEARAITWTEIDLATGLISVVAQFDADDEFDDPKTAGSTRTLQLHPHTVEELAHWHEAQSAAGSPQQLIMATRSGSPLGKDNYRRDLKAACRKANVPEITPYELRHTAITHQIEAGKDIVQVADWAGTSVEMIERHYRKRIRRINRLEPPDYR